MPPDPPRDPATDERRRLAEAVRAACLDAVRRGYEDAAISGLCDEGAFEAAVGALQMLDLEPLVVGESRGDGETEKMTCRPETL